MGYQFSRTKADLSHHSRVGCMQFQDWRASGAPQLQLKLAGHSPGQQGLGRCLAPAKTHVSIIIDPRTIRSLSRLDYRHAYLGVRHN